MSEDYSAQPTRTAVGSDLPFRQIHLDFHTSPDIPDVGADFDAQRFAQTLLRAKVSSVTLFARCHHGHIYYRSEEFADLTHPHLVRRDLLHEQVQACHRVGIRTPVYITVQWDHRLATLHPEWLSVKEDGSYYGQRDGEAGFYRNLCVNSPYREFLFAQTADVLRHVEADGVFFDIVQINECTCESCRASMIEGDIDCADASARIGFATDMINDFMRQATELVHGIRPGIPVFYNRGHVGPAHRSVRDAFGHFEIESLPSGGWGYLHFPVAARYARTLGLPFLGMTGKFHTSWGDFHSLKNRAALQFECFQMLALGGRCSIGDQLEPRGTLCTETYDLVGSVYERVESVESWCRGAEPVVEVGVFTPEEFRYTEKETIPDSILGAVEMMQELGLQFDIVDSQSDLSGYRLIVLPDNIDGTPSVIAAVRNHVRNGGSVIASFESGLCRRSGKFALDSFGVIVREPQTCAADGFPARGRCFADSSFAEYLVPGPAFSSLYQGEHTMYIKGLEVEAMTGTSTLAQTVAPYFHRDGRHFCSHRQAPSSGKIDYPAVVENGAVIYFAHPIFTTYRHYAPLWCKQLIDDAVSRLMSARLVRHDGPSSLLVTIGRQLANQRFVVHLLHYIPQRRATSFDIIEDVIPLRDVKLSLCLDADIENARVVPGGPSLELSTAENRTEIVIPELRGYATIELTYNDRRGAT
jgi:hypothetical protein